MKAQRARRKVSSEEIARRWGEIVGEMVAAHTRVTDLQRGILHVEVDSPPLLHELATYFRDDILLTLKETEEFRAVQEIRFRAGSF